MRVNERNNKNDNLIDKFLLELKKFLPEQLGQDRPTHQILPYLLSAHIPTYQILPNLLNAPHSHSPNPLQLTECPTFPLNKSFPTYWMPHIPTH